MKHKKITYIIYGILTALGLVLFLFASRAYVFLGELIGLAMMAYGILGLFRAMMKERIKKAPFYKEQDEKHTKEIQKLQWLIRTVRLTYWLSIAIAACLWVVAIVSESFVAALIASIIAAVFKMVLEGCKDKHKSYVADHILREALEEVFDVSEYRPFGCIDESHVWGSHFGISEFDRTHGSDYMKGFYKGLPIELCDMELIKHETRTDEDGRTEEYDVTVFKGLWMICDFGKELVADIRLWERGNLGKLTGGSGIQTENESFHKRFHIESEDEVEAFYILTPHMMEYILEMDRKAKGKTHIRFERGGRVQIAIGRGKDSFEPKQVKDATLLRKQFVKEIRYITDLIDELRLVDTMYRRSAIP